MSAAGSIGQDTVLDMLAGLKAYWVANRPNLRVGLFQNNYDPVPGSVLGDFTAATFSGYSVVNLNPSTFGTPAYASGEGSMLSSAISTFTNAGTSQTIYGYYVWDNDTSKYLFGESFGSPVVMTTGYTISVQPKVKERSAYF